MIGIYCSPLPQAFEIVSVLVHCFHNSQHLLVVDFVIEFCINELPTHEHNGVQFSVVSALRDHCSHGEIRGVGFKDKGFAWVEVT